ncbi:MAG: acyl-CoA dehydrogenase [Brevundimonas sp.]|nr:acyl-CoA dehydrogenase [Brevundimonas sp.]
MTIDGIGSALSDQLRKLLESAPKNPSADTLWPLLDALGLYTALASEDVGGHGLDWSDLNAMLRVWGGAGAPVDLASPFIAAWALERAGIPLPNGFLQLQAPELGAGSHRPGAWRVRLSEGGERDDLSLLDPEGEIAGQGSITAGLVRAAHAVLLSAQIAGALDAVLTLSVDYALTRTQFGRPIAKFQAVQALAANLAMETAAAGAAADFGLRMFATAPDLASAVAKIRASKAATGGAALAHQIHGAIGVTEEHDLHRLTRSLWRWRDQAGGEHAWAKTLGAIILNDASTDLWGWMTQTLETAKIDHD